MDALWLKTEVTTINAEIKKLGSDLEKRKSNEVSVFNLDKTVEAFISKALPDIQKTLEKNTPKLQSLLKDAADLRINRKLSPYEIEDISWEILSTLKKSSEQLATIHKYAKDEHKTTTEAIQKQIASLQNETQIAFFWTTNSKAS